MATPTKDTENSESPVDPTGHRETGSTDTDTAIDGAACPIAVTMEVIGDRWTLLIIRDLIAGKTRFGEFVDSSEHIPTNVLTDRLRRLESQGILERRRYSDRPPRHDYVLTEKGRALRPVLHAICAWGNAHYPDTRPTPDWLSNDGQSA